MKSSLSPSTETLERFAFTAANKETLQTELKRVRLTFRGRHPGVSENVTVIASPDKRPEPNSGA